MKLYVYCLVEHTESLPESLHGITGSPVRRLDVGDFSFLVSDFSDPAVTVTRENALAHASAIQSALKKTTVLPFRFGTLVTQQELKNFANARGAALRTKLKQVRGCVEMNVKILSDGDWTEESSATVASETPGTAFLSEKRREILGGEARAKEAKQIAEWLDGLIGGIVKEKHLKRQPVHTNATRKLIFDAAYLIEAGRVDEFRTRVNKARAERPDLRFLVSGPWAPYSFADLDLEFKTHFGVS